MANELSVSKAPVIVHPPPFCEYACGPCDQGFDDAPHCDGLFLYPSEPEFIAVTIEEAVKLLRGMGTHRLGGTREWNIRSDHLLQGL